MKIRHHINYALIGLHFLGTVILILGARQFSLLHDLELFRAYSNYGDTEFTHHLVGTANESVGERIYQSFYITFLASILGLITSFCISLIISLQLKPFWINSFCVLVLGYLAIRFGLLDFAIIKFATNYFGKLFISYGLEYAIFANGTLLTLLGLAVYFNPWTTKLIQKSWPQID